MIHQKNEQAPSASILTSQKLPFFPHGGPDYKKTSEPKKEGVFHTKINFNLQNKVPAQKSDPSNTDCPVFINWDKVDLNKNFLEPELNVSDQKADSTNTEEVVKYFLYPKRKNISPLNFVSNSREEARVHSGPPHQKEQKFSSKLTSVDKKIENDAISNIPQRNSDSSP